MSSLTEPSSLDDQDPANVMHFTARHEGPCFHVLRQLDTGEHVLYDARHYFTELIYYRPHHRPQLAPFPEGFAQLPCSPEADLGAGIMSMSSTAPSEAARMRRATPELHVAIQQTVDFVRVRLHSHPTPAGPAVS